MPAATQPVTAPLRIAALIRMSSDAQANSPERQRLAFAAYCDRHALVAAGEYADLGVSATHTKAADRTGLQALLRDAAKGNFELVFLEEISRAARRAEEFFPLEGELRRRGIAIVTKADDPRREVGSAQRFAQGVMALAAELEAGLQSERIRNTQRMMIAAGKYPGGDLPLGLAWDRATETWELDEHGAEMALRIFSSFLQTHNLELVARDLNAHGYRTTRGNAWTGSSVRAVLHNPVFRGRLQRGGEEFPVATLPTIVPAQMVARVDLALAARQTRTKRCDMSTLAVFSGLIQCPACHNWMTHSISTKSGKKDYIYYYCYRARREGYDCTERRFVGQNKLEKVVLSRLVEKLEKMRRALPAAHRHTRGGRPVSWGRRVQRVDEERERLLAQHQRGWIDEADMERRLLLLADRKATLAREATADDGPLRFTAVELDRLLPQVTKRWWDWPVPRRRELLQTMLDHIVPDFEDPADTLLAWKD